MQQGSRQTESVYMTTWVWVCFCTCKHHMPISETWIRPYPGFEKPDYVKRSTLTETGILLHCVHLIPVSDCCWRPAQVQLQPRDVTGRQTMAAMRASRIWSDKDIGGFCLFSDERVKYNHCFLVLCGGSDTLTRVKVEGMLNISFRSLLPLLSIRRLSQICNVMLAPSDKTAIIQSGLIFNGRRLAIRAFSNQ